MLKKNNDLETELDLEKIKNIVGEARYQHTEHVVEAALRLAQKKDLDLKKVKKAAMLHDIAKNKNYEQLLELVKNSKWKIDDLELAIPSILHAPAGAVVAEKSFAITDQEILEAIRFHSLAHPEMGELAKVVFAADYISADRKFEGIDKIRAIIAENFELGLYSIMTNTIKYQLEQHNYIHPYSNSFRNKLLKRSD